MDKKRVGQIKEQFDLVIHSDETAKIEFWYARDLMSLLGYERWENFDKAIGRAMESCKTSGIEVSGHFREVTKMTIFLPSEIWWHEKSPAAGVRRGGKRLFTRANSSR